jgi:hypothetical protein
MYVYVVAYKLFLCSSRSEFGMIFSDQISKQFELSGHTAPNFSLFFTPRCKVCSEVVLFESTKLQDHLYNKHRLSLSFYRDRHLVRRGGGGGHAGAQCRVFTDDPREMCVLVCQICGARTRYLGRHIRDQHRIPLSLYKEMHLVVEYARQTYHRYIVADPGYFIYRNFFPSWICITEFKYFNPKKLFLNSRKYDLGCSSRIRIRIFYPSRIPGSKRHIQNRTHDLGQEIFSPFYMNGSLELILTPSKFILQDFIIIHSLFQHFHI